MMSIARLLSIFAMIAMISAPAMACCLTGHDSNGYAEVGASHAGAVPTDAETCHDHMADAQSDHAPTDPEDPECSGCIDCEATLASSDDALQPAPFSGAQTSDLLATIAIRFSGFDTPRLILTTGPPEFDHVAKSTPVELKQILLI